MSAPHFFNRHVRNVGAFITARRIGLIGVVHDREKIIHSGERKHVGFHEADIVLLGAVELHEAEIRLRPFHAVLAFRVTHGPPIAGRLAVLGGRLRHGQIPHAKLPVDLQHAAVKARVAMIRRAFRAVFQHGIGRMLPRLDHREFQVIAPPGMDSSSKAKNTFSSRAAGWPRRSPRRAG